MRFLSPLAFFEEGDDQLTSFCDGDLVPDAVSGATPWKGDAPPDPSLPAPGVPMSAEQERAKRRSLEADDPGDVVDRMPEAASRAVAEESGDEAPDGGSSEHAPDALTGATPGVAAACRELDMGSLDKVIEHFDINPPGVA